VTFGQVSLTVFRLALVAETAYMLRTISYNIDIVLYKPPNWKRR